MEVYLHGDWGSICDSGWNDLNAAVVCRQLGHRWGHRHRDRSIQPRHKGTEMVLFPRGGALAATGFGRGKGPVHLDQVRCTGKEEFLGECPSLGQKLQGCRRRDDAGVRCDVTTREWAPPAGREGRSCGLRKLVEEEEDKRREKAEEKVFRWVENHQ